MLWMYCSHSVTAGFFFNLQISAYISTWCTRLNIDHQCHNAAFARPCGTCYCLFTKRNHQEMSELVILLSAVAIITHHCMQLIVQLLRYIKHHWNVWHYYQRFVCTVFVYASYSVGVYHGVVFTYRFFIPRWKLVI